MIDNARNHEREDYVIQVLTTILYLKVQIFRFNYLDTGYTFQSNTTIYYTNHSYGNMFRLYWVIITPSKEQIQRIKIYSAFWDPKMHYKFWYNGSVLWKAWWWLNRVETYCHKYILCNKYLCLTEIYTLYELHKHIGMTNFKLTTLRPTLLHAFK
jgi:hypothetical protein